MDSCHLQQWMASESSTFKKLRRTGWLWWDDAELGVLKVFPHGWLALMVDHGTGLLLQQKFRRSLLVDQHGCPHSQNPNLVDWLVNLIQGWLTKQHDSWPNKPFYLSILVWNLKFLDVYSHWLLAKTVSNGFFIQRLVRLKILRAYTMYALFFYLF